MTSFLLCVMLLARLQGSGVVSGLLRDVNGNAVSNVRVALAEVSNTANDHPVKPSISPALR